MRKERVLNNPITVNALQKIAELEGKTPGLLSPVSNLIGGP